MSVSIRSYVTAGISVVAAGIIAIPPSVAPQMTNSRVTQVAPPIELAASVRSLIVEPPSPQKFAAAVAAIERIDPSARETALQAVAPAAAPVPLNAASDLIVSGYQFIQYWVNYGVELTNYVLNFIPYGYLISAQVNIFYYNLIRPISDSVVYQLIVPVVNDPLNPVSYVNGLINVGQAAINAAINTGIAEFNYFFGWLIPPLPPLPLAAVAKSVPTVEEDLTTPLAAAVEPTTLEASTETLDTPAAPVVEKHQFDEPTSTAVVTETEAAAQVENAVETAPTLETTHLETTTPETTTSANGVQAQGEVRGGTTVKDEPTTVTDPKPADTKPAEAQPADTKPVDTKPVETKPVETKPVDTKPVETKTPKTNTDPKDGGAKDGGAKD